MTDSTSNSVSRRRLLMATPVAGAMGFATYCLLNRDRLSPPAELPVVQPPGAQTSHFPPRARNVIFLMMAGGPSQVDLLDPKPELERWAGKPFSSEVTKDLKLAFTRPTATAMPGLKRFRPRGESGIEISDWLPHLATHADDICLIRSMHTEAFNHHPGQSLLMSGSMRFGRPSIGSWVSYGLGSETNDLPAFVVLTSGDQGPEAGANNWSNGFLPSGHRGVAFLPTDEPIPYLRPPPGVTPQLDALTLYSMRKLNAEHYATTGDPEIASRMASYEMAFRLQSSAPELFDLSGETAATQDMYGFNNPATESYGYQCLMARRMVERGVRFVMLANASWDGHTYLSKNHDVHCEATDRPVSALLTDLKQRGMLDDTLVVWGGEFGRTPMAEMSKPHHGAASVGRDHHATGFSMWLAGGGTRAGHVVGATDELGLRAVERPVHIHDLQATILHILGLDHERLTYRQVGREFRLTDVGGNVVREVLS